MLFIIFYISLKRWRFFYEQLIPGYALTLARENQEFYLSGLNISEFFTMKRTCKNNGGQRLLEIMKEILAERANEYKTTGYIFTSLKY